MLFRSHRINVDTESVQVEQFRWDEARKVFRRSDVFAFARPARVAPRLSGPKKAVTR